jgi:TRAP-type uncharacterized transport system substrate-binding protein
MRCKIFCIHIVCLLTICGMFGFSNVFAQETNKIEISALWPGSSMYTNAVLWAKLINEGGINIQATAREGRGPDVDMKTLMKEPGKRSQLIFFGTEDNWWGAQQGWPGWDQFLKEHDIKNLRHLCVQGFTIDAMLTSKPEIKTMYDMQGKSFVPANVSGFNSKSVGLVEPFNIAGVKIKTEILGVSPMIDSLRDGLIDVIHGGIALIGPNAFQPSGYLNELLAVRKIYGVTYDPKMLTAMKDKTGHPGIIVKLPPKSINEHQEFDVYALGKVMTWMVDVSMPDNVVKEILQVYYDNIEKFGELSVGGKMLTKDTMAALNVSEDRLHPAAVQFYKEKGVPIASIFDTGLLQQ